MLAILGYIVEPRFYLIWVIFFIFGVATVPQVMSMALKEQWKRHNVRGR